MVEFTVDKTESGMLLQDVFAARFPSVPFGRLLKALRARDVKVDGHRVSDAKMRLLEGNTVKVYVDAGPDAAIDPAAGGGEASGTPDFRQYVVFENEYIIVAAKPQGMLSEPDRNRPGEAAFSELFSGIGAELCHRLDRNTGGLLILSKKPELTEGIKRAINARRYRKIYAAKVIGDARKVLGAEEKAGRGTERTGKGPETAAKGWHTFKAWHRKDAESSIVTVSDRKLPGSREIETRVRFVDCSELGGPAPAGVTVSDVEVMLITGRTHQIRAHLAHLGIPVAGDGKYGSESVRRRTGLKYQALWACRLEPSEEYAGAEEIGNIPVAEVLPERPFYSRPEFR